MNTPGISHTERGAVLVISMLFLLVVTIISVVAARNSSFNTKMALNMQDGYSSFQSAEAGILAVLLLADTTEDPFKGVYVGTPFQNFTTANHPLRDLNGGTTPTTVHVYFIADTNVCPPKIGPKATSQGLFDCEYYRTDSENTAVQRARTRMNMGVVKTLLKSTGG